MAKVLDSVEHLIDVPCELAEGPLWDDSTNVFWWVDITARTLHRWDPDTGEDTAIATPTMVGAVGLTHGSHLIAAVEAGFALLDPATGEVTDLLAVDGPVPMRMNDGKVDPAGRFLAGLMGQGAEENVGVLYRFDGTTAEPVLEGLTIPNGLGWSPDGSTMYYVDSPTRRLDAFDHDEAGSISNRRTLASFEEPVLPDGLTVDSEGAVWLAFWGGGAVHRYLPSGELDVVIEMPVEEVTSCAFGGPSLDQLFITAASNGVFRCTPGVTGMPSTRFASAESVA